MTKQEVLRLIDVDIQAAFDELDSVFKRNNPHYNDLNEEFYARPENFSKSRFRDMLKRFVSMNYPDEDDDLEQATRIDYYKALCELDFKQQTVFFERIYKYKKIAPFLLHGKSEKDESDLKWLCNQILYKEHLRNDRYLVVDCGCNLGGNFERLLEELYQKFNVNSTSTGNKPLAVLRNAIQRRLETGSFVCIVRNATKFLWDEGELGKMFEQFLKYLDQEIVIERPQHAFILLFIDSGGSGYVNQFPSYFFWYDESAANNNYSHNAVKCKEMRIFDLSPVAKIKEEDITAWIGYSQGMFPALYPQVESFIGNEKVFLEKGDSPIEVIQQICEILKIKIEDEWIN